jgi:tetratricopeptide (TPR) repeat protein
MKIPPIRTRSAVLAAALALSLPAACHTSGALETGAAPAASELEQNLARARADYERNPTDEDAIIWLGRRLAYLERYEEAVDVYTRGLELHPESYKLLRHRGHRYITLRDFARAEADLRRAAELCAGVPDEIEPDGKPNAWGVPRDTVNSNVFYHLGLALYLQGRYAEAAEAYRSCVDYAKVNDDMLAAATYWLYLTLRRLGRDEEAQEVLAPIHERMAILANHGYYQLLRLYRGWTTPDELMAAVDPTMIDFASRSYGLAIWHLVEGRADEARLVLERLVASGVNPAAFGRIAAEVDLAPPSA